VNTIPLWVTLLGFVAPFVALAGSAVAFVWQNYRESKDRRWNKFFDLMKFIDSKDLPIATKSAAVYQLRQFPEHKDFIIRFCTAHKSNIVGPASQILATEMESTVQFFDKIPRSS
jgi:hypothetical protein